MPKYSQSLLWVTTRYPDLTLVGFFETFSPKFSKSLHYATTKYPDLTLIDFFENI